MREIRVFIIIIYQKIKEEEIIERNNIIYQKNIFKFLKSNYVDNTFRIFSGIF